MFSIFKHSSLFYQSETYVKKSFMILDTSLFSEKKSSGPSLSNASNACCSNFWCQGFRPNIKTPKDVSLKWPLSQVVTILFKFAAYSVTF
jgi:hypothetical protein